MADMISWADRLYSEGVDNKDAAMFADAFTSEGWLRFGNNPPLIGRDAIREAIAGFFSMFASLEHESAGTTFSDGTLVVDDTGRDQLLLGAWRTAPLRSAVARVAGPTPLRRVLAPLSAHRFRPAVEPGSPPPWMDCDTPADLARARQVAGGTRE